MISFKGEQGLFELTNGYSAYPEENEVLIQDGLEYLITEKHFMTVQGKQVCCIEFNYPAKI